MQTCICIYSGYSFVLLIVGGYISDYMDLYVIMLFMLMCLFSKRANETISKPLELLGKVAFHRVSSVLTLPNTHPSPPTISGTALQAGEEIGSTLKRSIVVDFSFSMYK